MTQETAVRVESGGRKVRTETLAVAPEIVGLSLAEPWRRLAAMIVDLAVIAALSLLTAPFLGLALGIMLALILGMGRGAPIALVIARWVCRLLGAGVILLSALALGHASFTRGNINLDALQRSGESPAMKQTVFVPPNATFSQLHAAVDELSRQVDSLKAEIRAADDTLARRAEVLAGSAGVTFGWSGIYFTLLTGLFNGRTVGKFLLRIRAAKVNGTRFTYFDGFIRQGGYVAGVAMGMIGFLKLLWEPNRQTVEDRIAATVVVKV